MKYVILIHSNPQPWGHPTSDYTQEYQNLPKDKQTELGAHWEKIFSEADSNGEIVYSVAFGDPTGAKVIRYEDKPITTDGPYAETKEHLAGMFVVDVASQGRAEEIARAFACPGDTIELRATVVPGDDS